jgi:hypothetical protein
VRVDAAEDEAAALRASERTIPLAKRTLDVLATHLAAFSAGEVEIEERSDPRKPVSCSARRVFTTWRRVR